MGSSSTHCFPSIAIYAPQDTSFEIIKQVSQCIKLFMHWVLILMWVLVSWWAQLHIHFCFTNDYYSIYVMIRDYLDYKIECFPLNTSMLKDYNRVKKQSNITLKTQSWGYKFIRLGSMWSFKLDILIDSGEFLRAASICNYIGRKGYK